ncbi:MAG: hypothetical protein WCJ72_19875 [Chryseobacterium sp.]
MKLVLEKDWTWNDNVLMYFDHNRPEMVKFPFWWYHIQDREIRFIKQVSKTFGVVFAENRWIPEPEDIELTVKNLSSYYEDNDLDSDTLTELERRSWVTLGQFVVDDYPNELLIEYPSGGGVIFKFHPTTKKIMEVTKCNSDGIIIYHCKVDFEETTVKETGQKKIVKIRSSIFDIRAFYRCESEQGEWQESSNEKWNKPWVFRELEDKKWILKDYKK